MFHGCSGKAPSIRNIKMPDSLIPPAMLFFHPDNGMPVLVSGNIPIFFGSHTDKAFVAAADHFMRSIGVDRPYEGSFLMTRADVIEILQLFIAGQKTSKGGFLVNPKTAHDPKNAPILANQLLAEFLAANPA